MNLLTIITTLIAAIVPSIISVMSISEQTKSNHENNEYRLKLKQLELYYSQKAVSVNAYVNSLSACLKKPSDNTLSKYYSEAVKISMYVSEDTMKTIDDITSHIRIEDYHSAEIIFIHKLSKLLNAEAHVQNQ